MLRLFCGLAAERKRGFSSINLFRSVSLPVMDNPLVLAAIAAAILLVGLFVYMKVSRAIMKIGFLIVAAVVLFFVFKDKLPL